MVQGARTQTAPGSNAASKCPRRHQSAGRRRFGSSPARGRRNRGIRVRREPRKYGNKHCRPANFCALLLLGTGLFCPFDVVLAQAGPPFITDDPGTPGDGHWEINLATIGSRTDSLWQIAGPDADINYGWGDHIQLKVDMQWAIADRSGERLESGFGATEFGVKWRFIDQEDRGFAASIYPQLLVSLASSSNRRGVTSPDKQVFLPVEVATKIDEFEVAAEIGRNLVEHEPNEWEAGVVVGRACGAMLECLVEVHDTVTRGVWRTLVNVGVHRELTPRMILLAALGRDFGPPTGERQSLLLYVGVQFLR
jgi:hypothetical protein